jgi:NAD(P)-dependent dehydrogenase (short-subunit alcohol dehydrogenase family)
VVTGANSGLGYATAKALAAKGATVVMACRRKEAADEAIDQLREQVPGAEVRLQLLDLASLESVREAAARLSAEHERIDLLINNAGVMAVPKRATADGFEMHLGTNHLGHFALTGLLLDRVLAAGPGSRIVTVTSLVHWPGRIDFADLQSERRYNKWVAYCQSKLANLLFTSELQRRLSARAAATIALSSHPGYAHTNLQFSGAEMAGAKMSARAFRLFNAILAQGPDAGALPTLRAATDPTARGDELYGPALLMRRGAARNPRAPQAKNAGAALRLWEISEGLTGMSYSLSA